MSVMSYHPRRRNNLGEKNAQQPISSHLLTHPLSVRLELNPSSDMILTPSRETLLLSFFSKHFGLLAFIRLFPSFQIDTTVGMLHLYVAELSYLLYPMSNLREKDFFLNFLSYSFFSLKNRWLLSILGESEKCDRFK